MGGLKILLHFILVLGVGGKVWAADLVTPDPSVPEPPPVPVTTETHTDHTNCNCGPRSHEATHGPSKIPLAKIVEIEKVKPASATPIGRVNSKFNWGAVLAIGAGAALGVGVAYLGYKIYDDYKDSKDDVYYPPPSHYPPSYLPQVPPPVAPYYYGYRPPYYYGGNPPPAYLPANPSYMRQPAFLGPPPAVLPPIYPQSVSYPLYPQSNYFGTQMPQYYPTYNFSGLPLSI